MPPTHSAVAGRAASLVVGVEVSCVCVKGEGVQEEAPADSWRLVCTSCFATHMKGSADG